MVNRQFGGTFLRIIVVFSVLGLFLTLAGRLIPSLYDYYLLRDLADRVVREYAGLEKEKIHTRVLFELQRSHIDIDDETFVVIKTVNGYRVRVDYPLDMVFEVGGYTLAWDGFEVIYLTYETES